MNRRDFLAGLSMVCAATAAGLQLKTVASVSDSRLFAVAKSAKVRHVSAYDISMDEWIHRFDILIGPDDCITEYTQQFGVYIRARGRMPTPDEIEPALAVLANHVEKVTGGKYEFTPGRMLSVGDNTSMAEYRA